MAWELARTENGRLTVSAGGAAIIAAVIGAVPPLVTGVLDRVWPTAAQASSAGTLEIERRKAATSLLQAALANPDSSQRRVLLEFLSSTNIVDTSIVHSPLGNAPYWPASPAK